MAVPPGDVAADHPGLFAVGLVVGAVEGEVAQCGELRLDPIEPGAVERRGGDLDVVRGCPAAYPGIGASRQVRTEVVADDGDPHRGRAERAQVAAEGQELSAALAPGDVAVELVPGQVERGEQVPDTLRAGVGRSPPTAARSGRIALAVRNWGP